MRTWFNRDDIIKMLEDIKDINSWVCDYQYNCPKEKDEEGFNCYLCGINAFIRIFEEGDPVTLENFFGNEDNPHED